LNWTRPEEGSAKVNEWGEQREFGCFRSMWVFVAVVVVGRLDFAANVD